MSILEEIKTLTDKANRYENQKERYIELAKKLDDVIGTLESIRK
jgi:hypothetical protein